jgi:hypothetical protein
MKNVLTLSSALFFCAIPSHLDAAPLKNSKVMQNIIRQCEYDDGVIIRLLASRECPSLDDMHSPKLLPSPPTIRVAPKIQLPVSSISPQETVLEKPLPSSTASATTDIILDKSIMRCTVIGFKKETADFRSCVTEQIKLLSK